jgi:hypothetical protein
MSQAWTVKIVPAGDRVQFDPDVFGIDPGQPLKAKKGDLVCWNNQTPNTQIVVVMKAGTTDKSFTTDFIDAFKSSSPGYVIQDGDIDKKGASGDLVGTVRYNTTYIDPGTPANQAPIMVDGTITVVTT